MKRASKLRRIIEGFYYSNIKDPVREEIANERAKECSKCKFAVEGRMFIVKKKDKIKEIEGLKCSLCGCGLSEKLRSKDEICDDGRW